MAGYGGSTQQYVCMNSYTILKLARLELCWEICKEIGKENVRVMCRSDDSRMKNLPLQPLVRCHPVEYLQTS